MAKNIIKKSIDPSKTLENAETGFYTSVSGVKSTKANIKDFIKEMEQVSVAQLTDFLGMSRQMIHRHLSDLVDSGEVRKQGVPPSVFYSIPRAYSLGANTGEFRVVSGDIDGYTFTKEQRDYLNKNFFIIDPTGERQVGADAFVAWCQKRNFDIAQKVDEYFRIVSQYDKYKKDGVISGMQKLEKTFDNVYVDEMLYFDFYSIEVFGKTKLGLMMLYAKQSQNKKLIKELTDGIRDRVLKVIKDQGIDAIGFIPPTVKREVQFIKELEKNLNISLPKISLSKIKGEFIVPQKTLNKLEDRVENAKQIRLHFMGNTVGGNVPTYKNILLIDDALGSGATINEVARQIKKHNLAKRVTGLAVTGSFSGFDVISEV